MNNKVILEDRESVEFFLRLIHPSKIKGFSLDEPYFIQLGGLSEELAEWVTDFIGTFSLLPNSAREGLESRG